MLYVVLLLFQFSGYLKVYLQYQELMKQLQKVNKVFAVLFLLKLYKVIFLKILFYSLVFLIK